MLRSLRRTDRPAPETQAAVRRSVNRRSLAITIGSFLFFSYFFCPSLSALEIPKRPEGYVSDYAGMISSSTRFELEEKLRRFEEETSNQVVVVTFPSLETESLEDFSIRLAEAWRIGQQEKNNGVILLIFKADRKVRIEVGYGLEGVLPDVTSKLIIENEIVPRFRDGKFDEGIGKAVDAIVAATKGEYKSHRTESKKEDFFAILFLFPLFLLRSLWSFENLVLILIAGILAFLLRPFFGSYISAFNWTFLFGIPIIVIYNSIQSFKIPKVLSKKGEEDWKSGRWWGGSQGNDNFGSGSFGGGGGGFGGGGGGGFGGGGASGGW